MNPYPPSYVFRQCWSSFINDSAAVFNGFLYFELLRRVILLSRMSYMSEWGLVRMFIIEIVPINAIKKKRRKKPNSSGSDFGGILNSEKLKKNFEFGSRMAKRVGTYLTRYLQHERLINYYVDK